MVPTGRLRGRVGYTQAANCPFQGLGCDIGKLAMYKMVREGFRVCGFIHDEFLIEIPKDVGSSERTNRAEAICREAMTEIPRDMRPEVESAVGPRWSKST